MFADLFVGLSLTCNLYILYDVKDLALSFLINEFQVICLCLTH